MRERVEGPIRTKFGVARTTITLTVSVQLLLAVEISILANLQMKSTDERYVGCAGCGRGKMKLN